MQQSYRHSDFIFKQLPFSRSFGLFLLAFVCFFALLIPDVLGQGAFTLQPPFKKSSIPFDMHRRAMVFPVFKIGEILREYPHFGILYLYHKTAEELVP